MFRMSCRAITRGLRRVQVLQRHYTGVETGSIPAEHYTGVEAGSSPAEHYTGVETGSSPTEPLYKG